MAYSGPVTLHPPLQYFCNNIPASNLYLFLFVYRSSKIIFVSFAFQINFVVQSGITTLLIFAVVLLKRDWIKRRAASDTAPNLSNDHHNSQTKQHL